MNKFIQKIKSVFVKRKRYVYFIDGEKYKTNNYVDIPLYDISSPDENTPAFENLEIGRKIWCEKDWKLHRLTGPAIIDKDGKERFYLNGLYYENIHDWLKDHPNQDNTFQIEMLLKYT
jgi:hypothetical protein